MEEVLARENARRTKSSAPAPGTATLENIYELATGALHAINYGNTDSAEMLLIDIAATCKAEIATNRKEASWRKF